MKETRLKAGKAFFERGEKDHPWAVEYAQTIPKTAKETKKETTKEKSDPIKSMVREALGEENP